ncbi:MAG: hypothetical protein P1P87_06460 [Trueperaceae bacterium]|nr:hypothetical protein [Trueperaceae bacterium]
MRLLGRFAFVLVVLGLLLGWIVRSRWGTRPGARFWWATFAPAAVHAAYVVQRAVATGLPWVATGAYAAASLALLVAAWLAVRRLHAGPRVWAAAVPIAHALAHAIATSLLGSAFSAASVAPPVVGPALVVGWALVVGSAWVVVLAAGAGGAGPGWWRRRRARLARRDPAASDAPARLDA